MPFERVLHLVLRDERLDFVPERIRDDVVLSDHLIFCSGSATPIRVRT